MVDGVTVKTSAGFTSEADYFDKHDDTLLPGEMVNVTMTADANDLSCEDCAVVRQ